MTMKTNVQRKQERFRALCILLMCLINLSTFAQVQVDESDLQGNWCVEEEMPSSNEQGMVSGGKAKGVFTYQSNGVVTCKIDLSMYLNVDTPEYKNKLNIDFSLTFHGNWSIKKGNVLVQKMKEKETAITPMQIVAEHDDSNQDKIYILMMKSMLEKSFLKEAKRMTKAGKEKILSFTETEMVTSETVYKRME